MAGERIIGWKLDGRDRQRLLQRFPPRYARTIADHVTFGKDDEAPEIPAYENASIVGRADDGQGVEALVVAMDGSTDRWDGSTWHVTWSLAKGREAVESNRVIAEHGWQPLAEPNEVRLKPANWPW